MDVNKFEYISKSRQEFDLPERGTSRSAGYDFHSPVDAIIEPKSYVKFSLEVKAMIKDGEFLMIVPRSSLGFKNDAHISLTNTVGIIDSDCYNNPNNEGEICVRLYNNGDKPFIINKNDRIVQGIFVKYDTLNNDSCTKERLGGLGSTGKQ